MSHLRINAALQRALQDAKTPYQEQSSSNRSFRRRVAMGDPQAPLQQVLSILDHYSLLGSNGKLAEDVQLVSLGDHFDWGKRAQRQQATQDGLLLLAWLAAHPPEQVILLIGNHDLARVDVLAAFTAQEFSYAQAEADALYTHAPLDPALELAFLQRYPAVPSVEILARDFSCFSTEQRVLVTDLLLAGRFRIAFAADSDLLLCHAGFTQRDLRRVGIAPKDHHHAPTVAGVLNAYLDHVLQDWGGQGSLTIPLLHQPGHSTTGEGLGVFYHRPAHPDHMPQETTALMRRMDPRTLPLGLTQVVGHTQDEKCRALLGAWVLPGAPQNGLLRSLWTDGTQVAYGLGLANHPTSSTAHLIFGDGAMGKIAPESYELLNLQTRQALSLASKP